MVQTHLYVTKLTQMPNCENPNHLCLSDIFHFKNPPTHTHTAAAPYLHTMYLLILKHDSFDPEGFNFPRIISRNGFEYLCKVLEHTELLAEALVWFIQHFRMKDNVDVDAIGWHVVHRFCHIFNLNECEKFCEFYE